MRPHSTRLNVLLRRLAAWSLCLLAVQGAWSNGFGIWFQFAAHLKAHCPWQPVNKGFILINWRSLHGLQQQQHSCPQSVAPQKMANVMAIKLKTCLWWYSSAFPRSRWCRWVCGDVSVSAVSPSPVLISPLDHRVHHRNHITFLQTAGLCNLAFHALPPAHSSSSSRPLFTALECSWFSASCKRERSGTRARPIALGDSCGSERQSAAGRCHS